jgi:TetR/AcrR family transcriptional regulator, transcriptional repressor for nem operon
MLLPFKTTGHIVGVMARPNTREDIVEAGLRCLVERGFNAVGVQDITDAAGVPKGSFYNHFESKEALGLEIVERYGANQTRREILTDSTVPPLQRLRRHFERITGLFADSHSRRLQRGIGQSERYDPGRPCEALWPVDQRH